MDLPLDKAHLIADRERICLALERNAKSVEDEPVPPVDAERSEAKGRNG